jgi:hypothetical protein
MLFGDAKAMLEAILSHIPAEVPVSAVR